MIEYSVITRDEVYERLAVAYNPPADQSADVFGDEWASVRSKVIRVLESFGNMDDYGRADFFIGEDFSFSRGIGIAVTSPNGVNANLIPRLVELVRLQEPRYQLCLSFDYVDGVSPILFVNQLSLAGNLPKGIADRLGLRSVPA